MDKTNQRILIIRLSSLGDVLLTTPIIRALKSKYPDSQMDYLVRTEYSDVVKLNPAINIVYALSREEKSKYLIQIFKKNQYDFVVDLQNNIRSRFITKSIGAKTFSFKKPNWQKYLLVRFKINRFKELKSIVNRYTESIPDLSLDDKGLEIFLPQEVNIDSDFDSKCVGLCPGAKHFTKRWPADYFIEIGNEIKKLGFQIMVFGGKDDYEVCNLVSAGIEGSINQCNDNQLFLTAAAMKNCKAVLCNDSGLMHLAAAVGIPVISIFGSSVKEFGFFPYGVENLILENKSLSCRPCSHIGKVSCPKKHFKCMKEITPLTVLNNFKIFLSKP